MCSDNKLPKHMFYGNDTAASSKGIAKIFATFFKSVYATPIIHGRQFDFFDWSDFFNAHISQKEIMLKIPKLYGNKGAGSDGVVPTSPLF